MGMQQAGMAAVPQLPWLQGKAEPELWHLLDLLHLGHCGHSSRLFCSLAHLRGLGFFVGNVCV